MRLMYKNYLFDLDGTLLPMDLQPFIDLYLQAFCQKFAHPLQLPPQTLGQAIWEGAAAMAQNDGSCLNREVFWRAMNRACGKDMRLYEAAFDAFYRNEFVAAKAATRVNPYVAKAVALLKQRGCRLIVATNPIFPEAAPFARIRWAALDPDDFSYVTLYDNSSFCKPRVEYYEETCRVCGIRPEESIMVGNDTDEDMCAAALGMDTFLVTDCLINRHDKDIRAFRHGSFRDFYEDICRQ